jgi:Spy/CpxP family protein refolding chaperone
MPRLRKHAVAVGLAVTLFGAGAIVGVAVDRHWLQPHRAHIVDPWARTHDELLEAFRVHLDLTEEQTRQIREIMDRTRAEAEAIHAAERPAMRELHERAQRDVLGVLTEEQADEYRRMIAHPERGLHPGH